ncbi:serine hydrolase [Chelatococcus asaccharovorans]|uniref:D-alanyl-D-alanine carboxypeptidase n=1 Tax=Chelatococcus asaccharovorans TaxID=28210 RepID=A0A2V3U676_9HYPH|nr:serine hydrolase [Chelatococcus asaccharovorans]MBS7704012.1 D-alanyl-D-alanine carboxypeptidase [Chelatococcus asaccharovorans]PXW58177.1 D-alanyl-D-alanine carboxypeptidase [Chelatococcus asaccharovorans]
MVWGCVAAKRHRPVALAGFIGIVASLSILTTSPAEARKRKAAPAYSPPFAAMVVDAKTGRTLYAKNEDEPRIPASITKVMTLYLLFEQLDQRRISLNTPLQVSAKAAAQPPTKLGVRPGTTIKVDDAINAMVTLSANDVSMVVAENLGGSEEQFARMMTTKARALGMSRTTFRNPHGLPASPPNITTARDLIVLGRAIQERFPQYYAYFETRSFKYGSRTIRSHNRLLDRIEGVDGIKTGYTRASGFNLLTSAKSGGREVVASVLGGRSAASRDNIMADLITSNLPQAYAGARQSSALAFASASETRDTAKPVAVASAAQDALEETTGSISPSRQPKAINLANIRPVVASASGSTATPSQSMQWNRAAAAMAPLPSHTEAPAAKALAVKAPAAKAPAATTIAKVEAKPEPRNEAAAKVERVSGWVIQLGATADADKANDILNQAKTKSRGTLAKASPFTEKVTKGGTTLYRARFSGFDPDSAQAACKTLKKQGFSCFATRG